MHQLCKHWAKDLIAQTSLHTQSTRLSVGYLNVSVGFVQNHFNKLWILQSVEEVRVKAVEVWLDTDALHHEVLRHPGHKLLLNGLLQLFDLCTYTQTCLESQHIR